MHSLPIKRDAAIAVTAALAGFAADYAFNLLLSRHLAAEAFGDYRVARAFAVFCGALVLLGGDRAAPRVLSHALDEKNHGLAWEYLRFFGGLGLTISILIIGLTWLGGAVHTGRANLAQHHAVSVLALTIPIMATGALASRLLQTSGRTVLASFPWRVAVPGMLIVGIWLIDWGRGSVTLNAVLILSCITVALIAVWQTVVVALRVLRRPTRAPQLRQPAEWMRLSLPMMTAFLVTIGLGQSDLYFLEWLGDEADVGHYAAAITTAHFVPMIQVAVLGVYAPLISRASHSQKPGSSPLFGQANLVMGVMIIPIAAGIALGSRPVLLLFGDTYTDAAPWLSLLALGNGAWAVAAVSTLRLQYGGQGMSVVWITSATLACDSVFNALLIPNYGPIGAAASSAATSTGAAVALWWRSRHSIASH